MLKKYLYLLITGLIFGSQFLITKFAIEGYTPLEVGMMRIFFGMLAVAIITPFVSTSSKSLNIRWYHYALVGFLEGTLPCVLVPWGQQEVASGIAAVIISTMPIFAMLFGPLFIKEEHLDWVGVTSILAGFIGVVILVHPSPGGGIFKQILPELAILLASASWALSLVFIKKMPHESPFRLTRNILIAATIEIIPIWLIFGHPAEIRFHGIPFLNAVLLGVFTSGIVYVFYVLLIRTAGVNFAAFSNYLVPIVGGAIGIIFLKERFGLFEIIGFIVIICALLIQTFHDLIKRRC